MKKSILSKIGVVLIALFAALLLFASSAKAEQKNFKPIDMALAKKYIANMLILTDKKSENFRLEINAMLDYAIHALRGPYTDGSGYKFAEVDLAKNTGSDVIASGKITEIFDLGKKQSFVGEARTTHALQISLPKYRSGGLFKNNGDAYIHSYNVEYTIDGKKYTIAKEFKNWLTRKNTIDIPLPGIAEWAKVEVLASVTPADLEKTDLEVRAIHPFIKDDPANPFSYSIDRLIDIQKDVAYMKTDAINNRLNEAVRGIDSVPAALGADLPPDKQIEQKLKSILDKLDGNSQDAAKQELKNLIDTLK